MTQNSSVLEAMNSARYATRLTHHFYRYPAAASPDVVREVIASFSKPGDLVLDPFLGGGTTSVEALALGRRCFGTDLNALGVFAARAKTTPLSAPGWDRVAAWARTPGILGHPVDLTDERAILPPKLRDAVASGLESHYALADSAERLVARCALLRIAQWAVESRNEGEQGANHPNRSRGTVPSIKELAARLDAQVTYMRDASTALIEAAEANGLNRGAFRGSRRYMRRRAQELTDVDPGVLPGDGLAKLVVTSPPYPRVHVLYHRWQIESRRETPAPYWIIGASDGLPPKEYTMGSRTPHGENRYFAQLTDAFRAVRPFLGDDCLVAQLVAFSDPAAQIPRFQASMREAGYEMTTPSGASGSATPVRQVPNRRWYARGTDSCGSRELLLFSRPAT